MTIRRGSFHRASKNSWRIVSPTRVASSRDMNGLSLMIVGFSILLRRYCNPCPCALYKWLHPRTICLPLGAFLLMENPNPTNAASGESESSAHGVLMALAYRASASHHHTRHC